MRSTRARVSFMFACGLLAISSCNCVLAQLSPRLTYSKKRTAKAQITASAPAAPTTVIFVIQKNPNKKMAAEMNVQCDDCTWTVEPWLLHGLAINSNGNFVGIPDQIQVFNARVNMTSGTYKAADGSTKNVDANHWDVTFQVVPANNLPKIVTASLPQQPVGELYDENLTAIEGPTAGAYVWSIDPNSLPPGLSANANGNIAGKSTTAGLFTIKAQVTDSNNQSDSATVTAEIDTAPGCNAPKYTGPYFNRWFFPLSRKINTDPYGTSHYSYPTDADVQCFYVTNGPVAPLTQVQYIYGFGGGANTISADLVSFQVFAPIGTQISLGTSVTAGGSSTSSATAPSTTPSVAAALQSAEAGGNFYVHILYPITYQESTHFSLISAFDPQFGFSFDGFAGQSTLSQGNEQYVNVPLDISGNLNGIAGQGGAFVDYKGGLLSVPGGFAKAAGLDEHNFYLNQFSLGLKFTGFLSVGAQRFWGPSAAFDASSPSGFNKWHLIIQLAPKT